MQQLRHAQTKNLTKSKIIKIKIMTEDMSRIIKIIALTGLIFSKTFGKFIDLYKKKRLIQLKSWGFKFYKVYGCS
jgi:hypothetical protein